MITGNKVLLRIFGPKGEEETGEWRKLQNEFCNLCHTLLRVIKSRR
jgi:hypothetical protein